MRWSVPPARHAINGTDARFLCNTAASHHGSRKAIESLDRLPISHAHNDIRPASTSWE
jgi:hypothetical protein